jgi:uncharacterized membrane protein YqiK
MSFAANAQVYKWVDSKGVTHYDEKPPENSKSKEVRLRESTPSNKPAPGAAAPAAGAGAGSLQERDRAFRQRQAAREEEEAKQANARTQREAECKEARSKLADLRQTPRLYDMNEKGERVFLSDKQRDETIAAREQEYNQFCK